MIQFRFTCISLNSEGFLIQQKGPMVRFINYFSIVENMFSHYTGLIRHCVIVGIYDNDIVGIYDTDNEATMTETNNDPKVWLQLPYLGKFGERLTRSLIHKITPLLTLKCRFIINWKTINSNVFVSCKDKIPKTYQSSVVYEFTCPGCNSRYIGITDRCLYTRTKEHAYHTESVIHQHLSTCEQFQHIKALLELYPDDDAMSNQNFPQY